MVIYNDNNNNDNWGEDGDTFDGEDGKGFHRTFDGEPFLLFYFFKTSVTPTIKVYQSNCRIFKIDMNSIVKMQWETPRLEGENLPGHLFVTFFIVKIYFVVSLRD